MMTKLFDLLIVVLVSVSIIALATHAIDQKYIQTDPYDITGRQWIDRDIYWNLNDVETQTQADTITLRSVGGTISTDTIQLSTKYQDADYMVFLQTRDQIGDSTAIYECVPLTDSSFTITKNANDSSLIQYMIIHK